MLFGSLSFLIIRLESLVNNIDMPGLLVVELACAGVTELPSIPRGTLASGGNSAIVVPITGVLENIGFTGRILLK